MMKLFALLLIATIGNVAAFVTPNNNNNHRQTKIAATAELDGLVGVDIESGKKIVRILLYYLVHVCFF